MLLNDLYTIDHLEAGTATLRLNAEHPIFKGHFPDRPVLPGACQLQMIRELLSHITAKTYRLQKAAAIKFITSIDPRQSGTIRLNLQYGEDKRGEEKRGEEKNGDDKNGEEKHGKGKQGEDKHEQEKNATLQVTATLAAVTATSMTVTATLIAGDTVCLKFNGTFQAE